MKINVNFLSLHTRIACFKHEGLKIEAFVSVVKSPYVNVSYEGNLVTHTCKCIEDAHHLTDLLITDYMNKIRSVEHFFEEL